MRHPRLRRETENSFYHCYNRVAGSRADRPFGNKERAYFIKLLKRLAAFYTVEVIAYQVMSNHFHLVLYVPRDCPSPEETVARYKRYYGGKRSLDPESAQCAQVRARLRDLSEFMADLQQQFTIWFNRTRPVRRRGALWAGRYKSTLLELGLAVWQCWKYVEMNPVRAHMVSNPADYRFCTFGEWAATGRHPFAESVQRHLMPIFKGLLHSQTQAQVHRLMRMEFARVAAHEAKQTMEQEETAITEAGKPIAFRRRTARRMRYWVDGTIIGSELFITEVMSRARGLEHMQKRRLTRAADMARDAAQLCCYRRLRVLVN